MRSHTTYLTFHVPERMGFVNITGDVEEAAASCFSTPLDHRADDRLETRPRAPS